MNSEKTRKGSDMESVCHKILFSADGFRLTGTLHMPLHKKPPVVIGSHGFLADSNSPKQIVLAKRCTASGIAYFRFDHRGCGQSEGIFNEVTSLEARRSDLLAAIETIKARNDTSDQIGLFGSSMGGATCIAAASKTKVASIVIFAAPLRSRKIISPSFESPISDVSTSSYCGVKSFFDLSDIVSTVHNILIIHGDQDNVVPVSNAWEIHEKAGKPKKLIVQKGGDHRMSRKSDQKRFIHDAVRWFQAGFSDIAE